MEINTINDLVEVIDKFKIKPEQVSTWKIRTNDVIINAKVWRELKRKIYVET